MQTKDSKMGVKSQNSQIKSKKRVAERGEVFTAEREVTAMCDLVAQECDRIDSRFLEPACGNGNFLAEILTRKLNTVKKLYKSNPYDYERYSVLAISSVYGVDIMQDNVFECRERLFNLWNTGYKAVCKKAVNTETQWERGAEKESHAYEFIHTDAPEKIFNMKFDVIISNPPYQLSFGIEGTNSANAKSIYDQFISKALALNPRYFCVIKPSRWMTKTAQGISDSWVESMIDCNHIEILHDFPNANDCFPGVSIMGGVSYFLWNREYTGKCKYYYHNHDSNIIQERFDYLDSAKAGVVIREPQAYSIIEKIVKVEGQYYTEMSNNFSGLVSPKHFFDNSDLLTSNWKGYKKEKDDTYNIKYYISKAFNDIPFGWIKLSDLPKNVKTKDLNKVFIPAANGSTDSVLGIPFYGEPNSVCSQTYLVIGYDPEQHNFTKTECENIISYIKTRFFRYLVSIKKKTQNGPRGVYQFVPMQDFSKPWTDEELYKKYDLTQEEIDFIESMIRPME